jgi:hypothetical protein
LAWSSQKITIKGDIMLEKIADTFLKEYMRKNPGSEIRVVHCHIDKPKTHVATDHDVHKFISTLSSQEDVVVRYDVTETDTDVPLNNEPEQAEVDIDLDEPVERLILARKQKRHIIYFAGFLKYRPIWTHSIKTAMVFESESDIIKEAFQMNSDGSILQDSFSHLGLEVLPAPAVPNF